MNIKMTLLAAGLVGLAMAGPAVAAPQARDTSEAEVAAAIDAYDGRLLSAVNFLAGKTEMASICTDAGYFEDTRVRAHWYISWVYLVEQIDQIGLGEIWMEPTAIGIKQATNIGPSDLACNSLKKKL